MHGLINDSIRTFELFLFLLGEHEVVESAWPAGRCKNLTTGQILKTIVYRYASMIYND